MTAAGSSIYLPGMAPARGASLWTPPVGADGDPDGLRPYQREAVSRIVEELKENRSTLLVMATGLGKTQTFGAVARTWPGRVLIVAHRDELIQQARRRMELMCGELVDVEQAEQYASHSRIVVASVQTLSRPNRLERFAQGTFGLVIVDECHHATADTYRRILDHFSAAKVLGVTATPDRQDEAALGQVFESVAYVREIHDGISDGYLCPITVRRVHVDAINLTKCRTVAGDLNQGDLDAVMSVEEALHGVAKPTVELAGDRSTIVFSTSVENAHRLAEIFNRYKPDSARAVDGGTETDQRRRILRGHQEGEYQYLVNVGVLTEGYDSPNVSCIAMGRPTKSRPLYTQCVGRGLRVAPGKADCLLLDFAGNSGRHQLISALDVLAGKYDDETMAAAKEIVAKADHEIPAEEALAEAAAELERQRQREAARRLRVRGEVRYRTESVDPFGVMHLKDDSGKWAQRFGGAPASDKQIEALKRMKVDIPRNCTKQQATALIGATIKRRELGLASYSQIKTLGRYGITNINIGFGTASRVIDAIARNGWKHPGAEAIDGIIGRGREAGEDG